MVEAEIRYCRRIEGHDDILRTRTYIKSSTTAKAGVNGIVSTYKNGGGIRVCATSGEAKREGVSRPHASLRGIQRRLSVRKVPLPPAVHICAGRINVTGH